MFTYIWACVCVQYNKIINKRLAQTFGCFFFFLALLTERRVEGVRISKMFTCGCVARKIAFFLLGVNIGLAVIACVCVCAQLFTNFDKFQFRTISCAQAALNRTNTHMPQHSHMHSETHGKQPRCRSPPAMQMSLLLSLAFVSLRPLLLSLPLSVCLLFR